MIKKRVSPDPLHGAGARGKTMIKGYGFIQRADRLREVNDRITAAAYAARHAETEREQATAAQVMRQAHGERLSLLGV